MEEKAKRKNGKRQSKIVKDEESWSPSRSWALGLLIALEIANLIYGPAFWYQLALQYKAKGWTEAARLMCRMSYIANPSNRTGQMAEAFSRVCLPKNNIPEEAQQKNIEGYNFDMYGEKQKARDAYNEVIKDYPNFEWPYNNLANMEIDIGNYQEAQKLCRKALAINPDYANAHTTLGRALWGMGLKDDAKLEIDKASKLLRFEK